MVGSWSTPIVIQVVGLPTRVIACDPETGSLLWWCGGLATEKVAMVDASPVVSGKVGVIGHRHVTARAGLDLSVVTLALSAAHCRERKGPDRIAMQ
jgi:hypothetical protein